MTIEFMRQMLVEAKKTEVEMERTGERLMREMEALRRYIGYVERGIRAIEEADNDEGQRSKDETREG